MANIQADGAIQCARKGDGLMVQIAGNMSSITYYVSQMKKIILLIDGIAFQSNILISDAALEVVWGGDHGKYFLWWPREWVI